MPLLNLEGQEDTDAEMLGGEQGTVKGSRQRYAVKVAVACAAAAGLAVGLAAWKAQHSGGVVKGGQTNAMAEVQQLDEVHKFPVQVDTTSFDCASGYQNWQDGWSMAKKKWCCTNYELGCEERQPYLVWLIAGIVALVLAGAACVIVGLAMRKRGREEELRSRWESQSEDKSRRCCTGWSSQDNKSYSWFRPQEDKRGCSSCCGDRR